MLPFESFWKVGTNIFTYLSVKNWPTLQNQLDDSSRLHWEGKNINIMWGRGKLSFCAFFFVRMTLLKARSGESWGDSASAASRNPPSHPTLHISLVNYEPLCLWQSVSRCCDSDSAISSTPPSLLFSPFCAAVIQTRTWNSVKILSTIQMIRFRKGAVNKLFLG